MWRRWAAGRRAASARCPAPSAIARPAAIPMATRIADSRSTRRRTSPRCAPSAMRMPISLRRDTLYDISPNRPIEARSRARPPKRAYLREQLFLRKALFDLLDLRRHVHQRQVGIDLTHRLADARRDARWRRRRPHLEHGAAEPRLRARHVHRRRRVVTDAVVARVAQHADDLELIAVLDARSEAAPERALVREIRPPRSR